jgi:hypothetical protein
LHRKLTRLLFSRSLKWLLFALFDAGHFQITKTGSIHRANQQVDTSQLRFSGFDEQFHLRALFPLGNQVVTFSRDDNEQIGTHYEYRPEIKRDGRGPIPTSAFLNNTDYKIVSAVLYCNANVGNIGHGEHPGFTLVHNFHAEKSLSQKLFRNELQFMWDGYDSIYSRKARNTDAG